MPAKTARLLEGKVLAQALQEKIKADVQSFHSKFNETLCLAGFQTTTHPSSEWYLNQQEKLAAKLGIRYVKIPFQDISSFQVFVKKLGEINEDPQVHGIFIAMPLPEGFDRKWVVRNINPSKDVDAINPATVGLMISRETVLIPPTASAAFELIKAAGIGIRGKRAAVVGQSAIVGRPLVLLLGEQRATITVCNTGTSTSDLQKIISESDIVVGCAGQPGLIKGAWIKEGAVVIDVGTTEVNGKLAGDVEFEAAKERAGFITPVPGGVGPLTVTMLMQNLIHAYQWQWQKEL